MITCDTNNVRDGKEGPGSAKVQRCKIDGYFRVPAASF